MANCGRLLVQMANKTDTENLSINKDYDNNKIKQNIPLNDSTSNSITLESLSSTQYNIVDSISMQPVIPEPSYLKSILLCTTQNSQLPNPVISNATSAETAIKSINNNIREDVPFSTTSDISKTGH